MPAEAGPLLDRLRRDAEVAIAERTAAAHAEAEALHDRAAARRDRRRVEAVAERERTLGAQRETARAEAGEATLSRVLTARDAFLGRVFAETEHQLNAMADAPDLAQRLSPMLAEALPFVEDDAPHARCAERVRGAVAAAFARLGRGDVPIARDDELAVGAVLENRDGAVRVDATLVARMRRLRPTLAIEAVRQLEGTGGAA